MISKTLFVAMWMTVTATACGSVKGEDDDVEVTIAITPANPTTTDDLVAAITGNAQGLSFRWSVNGGIRNDATTNRVAASLTIKQEVWRVEAVDGTTVLASAEVTIANSPPSAPVVTIGASPLASAPITCAAGASTDPDGDTITSSGATWTIDGAPSTATSMTAFPNDTLNVLTTHAGNVVACTVTVTDGTGSASGTAMTTVIPRVAYMARQPENVLRKIDLDTMTITDVGPLGVVFEYGDLAWDRVNQKLYMATGRGAQLNSLYTVNITTGAATLVGTHGIVDGFALGFDGTNQLFLMGTGNGNQLYRLDPVNAAATLIGTPAAGARIEGMTYDSKRQTFVGISTNGAVNTLNVTTAAATLVGTAEFLNDFGTTYDPAIDRYWVADVSNRLSEIDPTNNYMLTVKLPAIGTHAGIALALPPP